MAAREVPKSRGGMERCPFLGYWTLQSTFVKKVFDLSNPFMRKGKEREKMGKPQTVIYTKQLDHRAEVHSAVAGWPLSRALAAFLIMHLDKTYNCVVILSSLKWLCCGLPNFFHNCKMTSYIIIILSNMIILYLEMFSSNDYAEQLVDWCRQYLSCHH